MQKISNLLNKLKMSIKNKYKFLILTCTLKEKNLIKILIYLKYIEYIYNIDKNNNIYILKINLTFFSYKLVNNYVYINKKNKLNFIKTTFIYILQSTLNLITLNTLYFLNKGGLLYIKIKINKC